MYIKIKGKMRYLKLYEDYNTPENIQSRRDDIMVCFQDLIDDGFDISIGNYITIRKDGGFYINEVKETLLFAFSYIKSEYNINVLEVLSESRVFKTIEDFYKLRSDIKIESVIIQTDAKLEYTIIHENYTPIHESDIRDCFQDLIDDGFNVITEIEEAYIFILNDFRRFNIDDVEETLLFAIPYMNSEFGLVVREIRIVDNRKTFISNWNKKSSYVSNMGYYNNITIEDFLNLQNDVDLHAIKIFYEWDKNKV